MPLFFQRISSLSKVLVILVLARLVQIYRGQKNTLTYNSRNPKAKQNTERIISRCPSLQHYVAPFFHFGGILQSALSKYSLKRISGFGHNDSLSRSLKESDEEDKLKSILSRKREIIRLPEMNKPENASCCPEFIPAGIVSVDWVDPLPGKNNNSFERIVVLAPGLTGCSKESYIATFADVLALNGFKVACYNPRGRGGVEIQSSFLYSAGYTEDFRRVIAKIKNENPESDIFAIGFSLGANYLTKYIGEENEACVLTAAVLCACPLELISMSHHLSHSYIGRVMSSLLVGFLHKMRIEVEEADAFNHHKADRDLVLDANCLFDFDHAYVAPMFDLACGSDYYREASSGRFLSAIKVPCLFLHAANDPVVQYRYIRRDNFEANPKLLQCLTQAGGHSMAWPLGLLGRRSWAADASLEFFLAQY